MSGRQNKSPYGPAPRRPRRKQETTTNVVFYTPFLWLFFSPLRIFAFMFFLVVLIIAIIVGFYYNDEDDDDTPPTPPPANSN